jgi:hypothetical protein
MANHSEHSLHPVLLCLPAGERYHLELSPEELGALLAQGRKPRRERGMSPIHVELSHAGGHADIPMSPGELTHLLSRARLEADVAVGAPARPKAVHDPLKGRGVHDPAAQATRAKVTRPAKPARHGPERHHRHPSR